MDSTGASSEAREPAAEGRDPEAVPPAAGASDGSDDEFDFPGGGPGGHSAGGAGAGQSGGSGAPIWEGAPGPSEGDVGGPVGALQGGADDLADGADVLATEGLGAFDVGSEDGGDGRGHSAGGAGAGQSGGSGEPLWYSAPAGSSEGDVGGPVAAAEGHADEMDDLANSFLEVQPGGQGAAGHPAGAGAGESGGSGAPLWEGSQGPSEGDVGGPLASGQGGADDGDLPDDQAADVAAAGPGGRASGAGAGQSGGSGAPLWEGAPGPSEGDVGGPIGGASGSADDLTELVPAAEAAGPAVPEFAFEGGGDTGAGAGQSGGSGAPLWYSASAGPSEGDVGGPVAVAQGHADEPDDVAEQFLDVQPAHQAAGALDGDLGGNYAGGSSSSEAGPGEQSAHADEGGHVASAAAHGEGDSGPDFGAFGAGLGDAGAGQSGGSGAPLWEGAPGPSEGDVGGPVAAGQGGSDADAPADAAQQVVAQDAPHTSATGAGAGQSGGSGAPLWYSAPAGSSEGDVGGPVAQTQSGGDDMDDPADAFVEVQLPSQGVLDPMVAGPLDGDLGGAYATESFSSGAAAPGQQLHGDVGGGFGDSSAAGEFAFEPPSRLGHAEELAAFPAASSSPNGALGAEDGGEGSGGSGGLPMERWSHRSEGDVGGPREEVVAAQLPATDTGATEDPDSDFADFSAGAVPEIVVPNGLSVTDPGATEATLSADSPVAPAPGQAGSGQGGFAGWAGEAPAWGEEEEAPTEEPPVPVVVEAEPAAGVLQGAEASDEEDLAAAPAFAALVSEGSREGHAEFGSDFANAEAQDGADFGADFAQFAEVAPLQEPAPSDGSDEPDERPAADGHRSPEEAPPAKVVDGFEADWGEGPEVPAFDKVLDEVAIPEVEGAPPLAGTDLAASEEEEEDDFEFGKFADFANTAVLAPAPALAPAELPAASLAPPAASGGSDEAEAAEAAEPPEPPGPPREVEDEGGEAEEFQQATRAPTPPTVSEEEPATQDVGEAAPAGGDGEDDDDFGFADFASAAPPPVEEAPPVAIAAAAAVGVAAAAATVVAGTRAFGGEDEEEEGEDWGFSSAEPAAASAEPAPAAEVPLPIGTGKSAEELREEADRLAQGWAARIRGTEQCGGLLEVLEEAELDAAELDLGAVADWDEWLQRDAGIPDQAKELLSWTAAEGSAPPVVPFTALGLHAGDAELHAAQGSKVREVFFGTLGKYMQLPAMKAAELGRTPSGGLDGGGVGLGGDGGVGMEGGANRASVDADWGMFEPASAGAVLGQDMGTPDGALGFGGDVLSQALSDVGLPAAPASAAAVPALAAPGAAALGPGLDIVAAASQAPGGPAAERSGKRKGMPDKVKRFLHQLPNLSHLYAQSVVAS